MLVSQSVYNLFRLLGSSYFCTAWVEMQQLDHLGPPFLQESHYIHILIDVDLP